MKKKQKKGKLLYIEDGPMAKSARAVRSVKYLFIAALACAVFGLGYFYREEFNLENARRILSYLDAGASGESGTFEKITIETAQQNSYLSFRGGLAVLTPDVLHYYNAAGKEDLSLAVGYSSPAMVASDKLLLAYDRGGNQLLITNSYTTIFEKTFDADIINVDMNENGAFTVVTDEPGYRSAVTVFDAKQNEIYRWKTPDYYVPCAVQSDDGRRMAAICYSGTSSGFTSKVVCFRTDETEAAWTAALGSSAGLALSFSDEGLWVICDDKTVLLGEDGAVRGSFPYTRGTLTHFACSDRGTPFLALKGQSGAAKRGGVILLDENAAVKATVNTSGDVKSLAAADGYVVLLTSESVSLYDESLSQQGVSIAEGDARSAVVRGDGAVTLIYTGRAGLLQRQDFLDGAAE